MWSFQYLSRIDFRTIPVLIGLMLMSLLVISATTCETWDKIDESFFTPSVINQIKGYCLGLLVYLFFAGFDYQKLKKWSWCLYFLTVIMLFGLFFTTPIQNVQRWYRIPGLGLAFQPSEYAKLFVVMTLSRFLENKTQVIQSKKTALQAILIVFFPFI